MQNNHPYKTPPKPPPRKYGNAYYNPSMVEADEDTMDGGYPSPAPRSNMKASHPLLRNDSSHYQLKGTGMSLRSVQQVLSFLGDLNLIKIMFYIEH